MFHFAQSGEIENGEVRFQLKATKCLKVVRKGTVISFPINSGDLHFWSLEIYPFILVVFDAGKDHAFWLHVQEYVAQNPDRIDPEKDTVNVHIPINNKLTTKSIDHFRQLSIETVKSLRSQGGFPDVSRKSK